MKNTTLNHTIETMVEQLQNCDLKTLCAIKPILADLIHDIESSTAQADDSLNQKLRCEERYPTQLDGTLTRISDIHPGEKREFPVKIKDMSRQGMSLEIATDYIPSRINRVTFIGLGGKVKEIHMKIARMKKKSDSDRKWLNLGCRVLTPEQIRVVRRQEEKSLQILNRLHRKKGVDLLLVGSVSKENQCLRDLLDHAELSYQPIDTIHQAIELSNIKAFDLALLTEWDQIYQDISLVDQFNAHAQTLAKIALIKPNQNQAAFLKSGIDACLAQYDDQKLLTQALERGLIHHYSCQANDDQILHRKAVIICNDNEAINLLSYLFQEYHFSSQIYPQARDAHPDVLEKVDLLFVDFEEKHIEPFQTACRDLDKFPIIALCRDREQGRQAITHGAKDFLCLPPKDKDFQLILDNWIGA